MTPRISMVVISRNEGVWLKRTIDNLEQTLPPKSEIVVVDDASIDGSTAFLPKRGAVRLVRANGIGVAKARNFGGNHTTGDVIVFADAHLKLPVHWWQPMVSALSDTTVGAVAPGITGTNPRHTAGFGLTFRGSHMEVTWIRRRPASLREVPILPGCTLGMRRQVFAQACGGWDDGLLHRGNVDNEISVRLWLLGYRLVVTPEVMVKHRFRRRSPFHVGWPEYLHNRLRLAFAHFNDERLGRVVSRLRGYPCFGEALRLVTESDIAERRRELFSLRKRNDDWYFDRFRLNW